MTNAAKRIAALQQTMVRDEVDAWIILSSDPHLSEYLPEHWKLRAWFSGFTGSAGTLVVLKESAYLWADSRYWVQAAKELGGSGITLQKLGAPNIPSYTDFLLNTLPEGSSVALLGETISVEAFFNLEDALDSKSIELVSSLNPFNGLWPNRPPLPLETIYPHEAEFVSQTMMEKLGEIRAVMEDASADFHLVSTLDDIAWILNLRGSDVEYNPLFLSYLLIEPNRAALYVDSAKLSDEAVRALDAARVMVKSYHEIYLDLKELEVGNSIMLDPARTNYALLEAIPESCDVLPLFNPSTLEKALKSEADIAHVRVAMEEDGAALCEFFAEFEEKMARGEAVTELTVAEMLEEKRSAKPNYVSLSFGTIAGFNENGALPHYSATVEAHSVIEGDGLLLIDSGAQYQNGTTDITRVIPIGTITDAHKRDFTLVLKSMITMSRAHFPRGIKMPQLDAIARAPLWQAHLDYGHGTGHGVGYFMNVHEGPQVLSYNAKLTPQSEVRDGMITSIEPGLYREGKWGIRIENLVVATGTTQKAGGEFGEFMAFETLTLCPIDTRCIDSSLLTKEEVAWLNAYHQEMRERLAPKLSCERALAWLNERTAAI